MHFGGAHRTSLREILIPHVVKTIKESVFENCSGLTTVTLGDGLEENCGEGILQLHIATAHRHTQRRQGDQG